MANTVRRERSGAGKSGFVRLALCASFGAMACAAFADATWQGASFDLNADWSAEANWNGGVPTGEAVATIDYSGGNTASVRFLGLTPPVDFTGTIKVTYSTSDWDTCFHNMLKLTVLEGATWSVSGNGMLYATEGLSARIASDFTGVIVVPEGISFTVPSGLADAVEFVGDGRLVVSETKRLTHLSGFTGTLVWAGDAVLSPADTTVLQLRKLELANGASLTYAERILSANAAIKIKDWNEAPEDWTYGGTSGTHDILQFDTRLAHPNADGSLALVTDPKQIHSAVYTGRKLKIHDNWGVSFRYTPEHPADSAVAKAGWTSEWSGSFGFFMLPKMPDVADITYLKPLSSLAHGFKIYHYRGGDIYPYVGWFRGTEVDKKLSQDILNTIQGPNFRQPMDVTMSCQNGLMTVTLRQGEKYFAFSRNAKDNQYLFRDITDGFYLAFGASSDWWSASETTHNVPWSKQTISNFRGWYRAREAGRWVQDSRSFYPFTTDNCTARRYTAASTYVENGDALETDGSFKVESNGERLGTIIRLSQALDRRNRHLITYDLVYGDGTSGDNTEYFKFGFTRATDALSSWVYRWDASNNDITKEGWNNYTYPLTVSIYWYGGRGRCLSTKPTNGNGAAETAWSPSFSYPKMLKNQTAHTSLVYDGGKSLYYQVQSKQHVTDVNFAAKADYSTAGWGNGNNMFFLMSSYNTWGQVDTWLRDFTVKTLSDNQEVYLSGEVAVAEGATASFQADALKADSAYPAATLGGVSLAAGSTLQVTGSKAVIDSVRVSGSGATLAASAATTVGAKVVYEGEAPDEGLTLSGDVVRAADEMTFTIPEDWRHVKKVITLLNAPAAALPSSVKIVSETGRGLTARGLVTIADGKVSVDFSRGLAILIR